MRKSIIAAALAASFGLAACGDNAEETGENLDSSVEEAIQGQENLGDGPLEQAGERVDDAAGAAENDDPADALNDATDGDPSTNP